MAPNVFNVIFNTIWAEMLPLKILPTQYKWPVYQLVATFATTKPRGVYYRGVYLTISRTKSLHRILGIKLY